MESPEPNGHTATAPQESIKPPEGVVVPPKDIRAIVEKTAGYVVRNGFVFEDRVREKERNNPKFSFLNPKDAYSAFYLWRLDEIKEGRGAAVPTGRAEEAAAPTEAEKPSGPKEPPSFHFSARMPIINAQDLEVVKLTALFVAKRGKSFMTALSQRETRNYQFDFLRPQHSLYQFFTRLVDQYTILLRPEGLDEDTAEKQRLADLEHNTKDKFHILERAKQRAEWVKYQEKQKLKKEEEEEQERIAYAQIDWHDFVVVETILFTEADDQVDLPPPTSRTDLQSASLEQKAMLSLNPLRIEEAMPTEDDTPTYYNAYPSQPEPATVAQQQAQPYPAPAIPAASMDYATHQRPPPQPVFVSASATDEEQRIRERAEAREAAAAAQAAAKAPPGQQPMRIRSDYVPRAQARRTNPVARTQLCPYCKQQIPEAEFEEHLRIELLDPSWKEQRAKADSRSATTNLSTADVVNNLKRLASQRSDVFESLLAPGAVGGLGDPEEEARRKRMATSAAVGYDANVPPPAGPPGAPIVGPAGAPPPPQSLNIEEQIRHIHERYKQ